MVNIYIQKIQAKQIELEKPHALEKHNLPESTDVWQNPRLTFLQ